MHMIPEPLQSHPSVCRFYGVSEAFHIFNFRHEEKTGVHVVMVLSYIINFA